MRVTEILIEEHQQILTHLGQIESLIKKPIRQNLEQYEHLLSFITEYADQYHHAKEEKVYFVWMRSKNPGLDQGPLRQMLSEHDIGREHIRKVKNALAKYSAGDLSQEVIVKEELMHFEYLLRDHINKENTVLYEFAEQMNRDFLDGDQIMLPQFDQVKQDNAAVVNKFENHYPFLDATFQELR